MSNREGQLTEFAKRLGRAFDNPRLLEDALRHSSACGARGVPESNERLEFLGDRVLGVVIAKMLFEAFPGEPEGDLSRRFAALARAETLARVAADLGLGEAIEMSRSEETAGGRKNPGLLADACEAVIAAVYLDGGLRAAETFISSHWSALLAETPEPPQDAKTALQEWAQGRGLSLPAYRETARTGPEHAPVFEVSVSVDGEQDATGQGPSKRQAEQAAAAAMMGRLEMATDDR